MNSRSVDNMTKTAIRCMHCDSEHIELHHYQLVLGDCVRIDGRCADCCKALYADFLFDGMTDPDKT